MNTPELHVPRPGRPFLSLTNASFRLGDRIVFAKTTWSFRSTQQWVVTGPNGSGKTLFADALRGALPLVAGQLDYHFRPLRGFTREDCIVEATFSDRNRLLRQAVAQSRWSSIEEENSLRLRDYLSYDSVMEVNPYEVTSRHNHLRRSFGRRRQRAIRLMRLEPLLDNALLTLSNGEFQRAQLARALCHPARLLILDDPFSGLDRKMRRHLKRVLEHVMTRVRMLLLLPSPEDAPRGITHMLKINACGVAGVGSFRAPAVPPASIRIVRESNVLPGAELVRFDRVTVRYGSRIVLRNINWVVRERESWAVRGPNGSGKTTLLSLILGDHPQVYSNSVKVFGRTCGSGESTWELKRRIGWVSPELHQSCDLNLPCLEMVASGLRDTMGLFSALGRKERTRAVGWLRRFGLGPYASEPLSSLSTGMQRMVLLARALVKRPALLLLDEPCQGLDPQHREFFLKTVEELILAATVTVIYVSHREVPAGIARVLRLNKGRALEDMAGGWRSAVTRACVGSSRKPAPVSMPKS